MEDIPSPPPIPKHGKHDGAFTCDEGMLFDFDLFETDRSQIAIKADPAEKHGRLPIGGDGEANEDDLGFDSVFGDMGIFQNIFEFESADK